MVGGIDSPTEGDVVVDGVSIGGMDRGGLTVHRRTRIGFVFQFFNLIPTLTAIENVELVTELVDHPRSFDEVLAEVGLADRTNNFPSQLSGGEQQRVSIARALVKDPPILLCDEPTGELDYETGKRILGIIREICSREGKTVLTVTHNSAIGQIADRVIRLRSGRVLEDTLNPNPLPTEDLEW
jgi:putative ABC transport system ATP-binding protein